MPKIKGEHLDTYTIDSIGKTYTFTRSYIGNDPEYYAIEEDGRNNKIILHGTAESNAGFSAIELEGDNVQLRIASDGLIRGSGSAIGCDGTNALVINEGRIFGTAAYGGVDLSGIAIDARFINKGKIYADQYAVSFRGDGSVVVNGEGALIRSDSSSVFLDGAEGIDLKFVNHGKVESTSVTIRGGDSNDTIVNDGSIVGHVVLGAGNDRFVGKGGTLRGLLDGGDGDDRIDLRHSTIQKNGDIGVNIFGGAGHDTIDLRGARIFSGTQIWGDLGDDTFLVDRKIIISENAGGGIDLVKSSVSYDLSAMGSIENLTLVGKKNITALGSDTRNILTGNPGDNVMRGRAGADDIYGGRGNDRLFGGADGDIFVFKTRYGRDVIEDFSRADGDLIALNDWNAITDFEDLIQNHARNHAGSVWITVGSDQLIIRGIVKSELEAGDFYI